MGDILTIAILACIIGVDDLNTGHPVRGYLWLCCVAVQFVRVGMLLMKDETESQC